MTSRDLSYICRRCLADKNYELRCFFLMDKFGVGRCTEGTTLLWSNFKEYSEDDEDAQCPCIEWFRSKTGTMDDLCLMPDPRCFETCVIHAIASHACLAINPGPNIFTYRYLSETGNHVINMELKRIEQYWQADSDREKPSKFTKNLSTHSIRKLSKNILARQTKLPEQYADLRAGVSPKYNKDSKRAYVVLNWHMDSMCGRVLAGYDSIYSGGMCPTISAIPATDYINFNRLTLELFVGVSVPISILHMLSCSLLRHFFDYIDKFGKDSLIMRIESVAQQLQLVDKLKPWSEALTERFAIENQLFSPVTIADGSSVLSVIGNLVDGMNVMQRSVNHVIKFNATQERLNYEVVSSMHRLEENQADILNRLHAYRGAVRSQTSDSQSVRRQIGRQSIMDESFESTASEPSPQASSAKPLVSSIGSMSELFYNWYLFEMYNYDPSDRFEREKIKKLSKLIMYLRSFSATTMLQQRPLNDDSEAKRRWAISLQSEALLVQEKLMAFINAFYQQHKGKGLPKCTLQKAPVWSLEKLLKEVPVNLFPSGMCQDDLTPSSIHTKNLYTGTSLSVLR